MPSAMPTVSRHIFYGVSSERVPRAELSRHRPVSPDMSNTMAVRFPTLTTDRQPTALLVSPVDGRPLHTRSVPVRQQATRERTTNPSVSEWQLE